MRSVQRANDNTTKQWYAMTVLLAVACALILAASVAQARANEQLQATGVIDVEEIRIASELQGQVMHVLVDAGDIVHVGQELIVLESRPLKAGIQEAQTALGTAQAKLRAVRTRPRTEEVAYGQAQVAMAQAERSRAHASYQAAKRALDDPQALRQQLLEAEAQAALAEAAVDAAEAQSALLRHQAEQADWNSTERHILEQQAKAAEADVAAAGADLRTAEAACLHLRGMVANPLEYLAGVHASEGAYRLADARVRTSQAELRDLIEGASAADVSLAEAEVALAEASLHLAKLSEQRLTICSPVDGTVTARILSPGETALPGATLLTVADLRDVYVVVYVPQTALGQVSLGQRVEVAVDSFPLSRFEGSVTHIASEGQYTPRNVASREERVNTVYEVTVKVPNLDGRLKPGMAADALFG